MPLFDGNGRSYSRVFESIMIVTGPSFTSVTAIFAPNWPQATGRPSSAVACRWNAS